MLYAFDQFEIDNGKIELRRNGAVVPVEPQVFALLLLLVENAERMVSKDEIVEKVWDGRIVSDSAITSRIKFARRALGDDGKAQRFIRTVHGQGFRFVFPVNTSGAARASQPQHARPEETPCQAGVSTRPSLAVLPFRLLGMTGVHVAIADAIPHDLIVALSRLRWLFVIARGSTFRFRSHDLDVRHVGEALAARYCMSGIVEVFGNSISVTVELTDTHTGGIVWGDRLFGHIDDVHEFRAQIVAHVLSALEIQIPLNEAHLARLTAPENLDAWSAYHLALQHMYRFNNKDNAAAAALFESAIAKEPAFARAHAGLSFTHFQNAFLGHSRDRKGEAEKARRCAERSVELDPVDPFANFNMGRSFWLQGDLDGSLGWLDRATSLNPNYAQGFYARAWADTVSERCGSEKDNLNVAMALSPLDPLLYAMRATHALSCLTNGDGAGAARWADEAARTPGAHVLISLIAVIAHSLHGDREKAGAWVADVRKRKPDLTQELFFRSFPFADGPVRTQISRTLSQYGL